MPEIDLSYLETPDGLPEIPPRRRIEETDPVIIGAGRITAYEGLITADRPLQTTSRPVVSPASDPFRFMDFRVSWDGVTVSVRAGRVHCIQWSPPVARFIASSYVIPAETLPLILTEGQENRHIHLSLPWAEHGDTSFAPALDPPWPDTVQHNSPDGDALYAHSYWSGFDFAEYSRRVGLPAGDRKFIWTDHNGGTTPWPTDNRFPLATIGFSTGVVPHHFGSVFPRSGFDVIRNTIA